MALDYDYGLDREAVNFVVRCSAREQQFLVDACVTLARHPMARGDYAFRDAAGRENQVLDLGGFIVTYWADHAVRVVRIMVIERG